MSKIHNHSIVLAKRAVKLAGSLLFCAVYCIWCQLRRMAGAKLAGTCVVFYYHAVHSEQRANFARQLDLLTRWVKPVRADIQEALESGVHHAAITFHDGFVSVCENALPELALRKIPATLFIPSGYLGRSPAWAEDGENPDSGEVVLDVDRLKSLDPDLVSVGSHGVTHSDLLTLSEEEALEELCKSKRELEAITRRPVELFAFPYGLFSERLIAMCKQAGYRRVLTTLPTLAFTTPREHVTGSVDVSPDDWALEFKLKLLGAYRWLPFAFAVKRRIALVWNQCFPGRRWQRRWISRL